MPTKKDDTDTATAAGGSCFRDESSEGSGSGSEMEGQIDANDETASDVNKNKPPSQTSPVPPTSVVAAATLAPLSDRDNIFGDSSSDEDASRKDLEHAYDEPAKKTSSAKATTKKDAQPAAKKQKTVKKANTANFNDDTNFNVGSPDDTNFNDDDNEAIAQIAANDQIELLNTLDLDEDDANANATTTNATKKQKTVKKANTSKTSKAKKAKASKSKTKAAAASSESAKKPSQRGKAFSDIECLYLTKSYFKHSTDNVKGNAKKAELFWSQTYETYHQLVGQHNNNQLRICGDDNFDEFQNRTVKSLKDCWGKQIQPACNKFIGVVTTNPPASGEIENDQLMDLYWNRLRTLYTERAVKFKAPKHFSKFFQSYQWMSTQPKFALVFPPTKDGDEGAKGKRVPVSHKRPKGRDASKSAMARDTIAESITGRVVDMLSADSQRASSTDNGALMEVFKGASKSIEDMTNATRAMINNQVMMNAPTPERVSYFGALQSSAMMEADVQKKEMEIRKMKVDLEHAKLQQQIAEMNNNASTGNEASTGHEGSAGEMAAASNLLQMAVLSNGKKNNNDEVSNDEVRNDGENEVYSCGMCGYPHCQYATTDLPLDDCQVQFSCNAGKLHHACQAEHEFSIGLTNPECKKVCFKCHGKYIEYLQEV